MKIHTLKCDGCGVEARISEDYRLLVPATASWLAISRTCSSSDDRLGAGTLHFCSEQCLLKKLMEAKEASPCQS